ncbi:MAG: RDD family protein [Actinobacteria bacterium]|nr:RDD family protein [Actinomycetota bacterium]MBI3687833.1 RDD family protein [Actinomycetota bacterium]
MPHIVTGEAVALELRIAQIPSRVAAAAIDFAVMSTAFTVILMVGNRLLFSLDEAAVTAFVLVTFVAIYLGYPLVLETSLRGRTLGKMVVGLRVVRDDAGPITFRHALVRAVIGLTLERPGLLLIGQGSALALTVMLFSATGKRIGDMAAGTVVIQERIAPQPLFWPILPWPLAGWAAVVDLTAVDDGLALALRQFLSRAAGFEPGARYVLERTLMAELRARISPPPPPDAPGWAVLSAVLAERRRRDSQRLAAQPAVRAGSP